MGRVLCFLRPNRSLGYAQFVPGVHTSCLGMDHALPQGHGRGGSEAAHSLERRNTQGETRDVPEKDTPGTETSWRCCTVYARAQPAGILPYSAHVRYVRTQGRKYLRI